MKTKFKQLLVVLAVLAVLVMAPAAVKADPVIFTLDDAVSVAAGSTSSALIATMSNGGPPRVWLTGWGFTFSSPSLSADETLLGSLPFFLDSGGSYGPTGLFAVIAQAGLAPGIYSGSITIFGSHTEGGTDMEFTQDFLITVTGGQQAIPEPATMILLGSGLLGAAAARRRQRRKAGTP